MSQVIQAACPGCKKMLRIPLAWVEQPMKCKHCGLIFQARALTIPQPAVPREAAANSQAVKTAQPAVPPPHGVNLARTPPPPQKPGATIAVAPAVAAPVAVPFADLSSGGAGGDGSLFAQLEADEAPRPRRASSRRPSGGGWWRGGVLALCLLVVAAGMAVLALPYLGRLVKPQQTQLASQDDVGGVPLETAPKKPATEPAKPPREIGKNPVETSPRRPADSGPRSKPSESPSGTRFPRRALIISVNSYLYFNPINYGGIGSTGRNVHTLLSQLNRGLRVPMDQLVELSDATPEPDGKVARASKRTGAKPPLKSVIQQTVTDFLETSRAQDRIVVMFIGHAVEMGDEIFLVPVEGERDVKETLLPLKWLYDKMAACRARQKVLIMDVCRFDPSRGFERPGSGSADAKVEGAMTAKIDEALKNPPPGVQVWSACVADQFSLEYDNNGVFANALYSVAGRGIEGVIQRPDDPIRLDKLVEAVNKQMTAQLNDYGKKQTSRLAGQEPESGASYNPGEAPPPTVVPKLPVAVADAVPVTQIRKLLQEIDVPSLKMTREEMLLRAESMPVFASKVMDAYRPDREETEFRNAVKAAVEALQVVKGKRLQEEWYAPQNENAFKEQVTNYQKKEVSGMMRELDEALQDLKKAGTPEARAKETRRWQANYDYVQARIEAQLAYLNEYQGLLGQMKKELPPIDKNVQTGWRVASQSSLSDSAAKKLAAEAKKVLDKISKDYPGTPWEVLAKRDRLTALGMEWQAAKLGQ